MSAHALRAGHSIGVAVFSGMILLGGWSYSLAEVPGLPSSRGSGFLLTPHPVTWGTGAGKWVGYWGRRESVLCQAGGKLEEAWGTDIYTDDSSICTAAVHAGLVSVRDGGIVTIEMRPDAGYYGGTTRNGVTTGDWREPWTGSYVFIRDPSSPPPAIAASGHMQADSWPHQAGRIITFYCAPNFQLHVVYGSDPYTDDSYVCSAAVHAGILTQKFGGMTTIKLLDDRTSFTASSRHGVSTLSMEQWHGQSYTFVGTPSNTPLPPTGETPVTTLPSNHAVPDFSSGGKAPL